MKFDFNEEQLEQQKCDVGVLKIDQVNNNTLLSKLHCQHQAAETGHSVVWVPRLSINLPRTGKEGGSKSVDGSFPSSPMAQVVDSVSDGRE